jgi:autotransporter-associated beta strand protein
MALTNANDYAGDTVISNGIFRIGATNVIPNGTGKGNVVLEGKLDLNGFSETVNGFSGFNGLVDNSGATPATLTVGNNNANGVFAGSITNSGAASVSLTKNNNGTLVLLNKNGYSGGTTIGGSGTVQLAYEQSIGSGPLSIGGGSTFCWTDTANHLLANALTLTGTAIFGADTNGSLTVPGTVNFSGSNRGVGCNSDVLFQNGFTNGGLSSKSGPATLTVRNFAGPDWTGGSFQLAGGTLILDGATAVEHGNNFRIQGQITNGLACLVVSNGASLTTSDSATSNFKVGAADVTGAPGGTNQLDIYGSVTVTPYAGTADKLSIGGPSALDLVNLNAGGVLSVRQILAATGTGVTSSRQFNFNGGTLIPNTNDLAAAFMQSLDAAYVLDGGAIIDTAGFNITIGQYLLAGGNGLGGLTKLGAGVLTLGACGYTGDTLVSAGGLALASGGGVQSTNIVLGPGATFDVTANGGFALASGVTLKGNGTVVGTIFAIDGSIIAPGASIGTLIFSNAPSLGGALVMEIAKSGPTLTNDLLALAGTDTLTYGGTLTVVLTGGSLVGGEVFKLFNAESASYAGEFAVTNLPALTAPLSWDLGGLTVDGTIKVAGALPHPSFGSTRLQAGSLVASGSGGSAGGNYYVVTSPSVAAPLAGWTRIATNSFDGSGNFSFTNAVTAPVQFFSIELP